MTATTDRAEFLKSAERFAVAESAAIQARWGEDAADTTQSTPLHLAADATTEAGRQLAYLAQVRARDTVELEGLHSDLEGATISIPYAGRLGMGATVDMLVTRVRLDRAGGRTIVTGEVVLP